jgi:hypothetical protein
MHSSIDAERPYSSLISRIPDSIDLDLALTRLSNQEKIATLDHIKREFEERRGTCPNQLIATSLMEHYSSSENNSQSADSYRILHPTRSLSLFRENKEFAQWLYRSNVPFNATRSNDITLLHKSDAVSEHFIFQLCLLCDAFEGTFEERHAKISNYFSGRSIVEFGCGQIPYDLMLLGSLGGFILGIDNDRSDDSESALSHLLKGIIQTQDFTAEIEDDFHGKEDFVYSVNVLCEAVLNPQQAQKTVANCFNLLKAGGKTFHFVSVEPVTYYDLAIKTFYSLESKLEAELSKADPKNAEEKQKIIQKYEDNKERCIFALIHYEDEDLAPSCLANYTVLLPEDFSNVGFIDVKEYFHDGGYSIVATKPD